MQQPPKTHHDINHSAGHKSKAKKPLHFDTFGNVHHVLEAIDHMVPIIFKGEDLSFIPSLKNTIRMHAHEHHWDVIVLSLSKGMARQELDVLLNHLPEHEGPLVIDATASTPEHDVVYNENLLLSRKERIMRLNDETGDVMIVLYGIDGLDAPMERKLLMRRMHYMGVTLDMLLERNDDIEAGATEEAFTGTLQRALSHIRSIYAHDKSEEGTSKNEAISGTAFMALAALIMAFENTNADYLKERLAIIVNEVKELPEVFKALNLSYEPFVNAANQLQNNPATADASLALRPETYHPETAHLLQNNPSSADMMQNSANSVNEVLNNTVAMGVLENTPNAPLLVNNPVIKEKVAQEHKHHHYEQIGPKMEPS
ncbi:MAG: hypothetical protein K2Q32_08125 [Alphaproteobacteria bacterium]|nr:hypothetical protein [Alphaproteobacteria bacterium]